MLSPQILPDGIILSYKGLDGTTRYTRITALSQQGPPIVTADSLTLNLTLDPRQTVEPVFKVESFTDEVKPQSASTIDADSIAMNGRTLAAMNVLGTMGISPV